MEQFFGVKVFAGSMQLLAFSWGLHSKQSTELLLTFAEAENNFNNIEIPIR